MRSGLTLQEATRAYARRFRKRESDLYRVARSLTYFVDAEKDPLFPAGLTPRRWQPIKAFFVKEAGRFIEALAPSKK